MKTFLVGLAGVLLILVFCFVCYFGAEILSSVIQMSQEGAFCVVMVAILGVLFTVWKIISLVNNKKRNVLLRQLEEEKELEKRNIELETAKKQKEKEKNIFELKEKCSWINSLQNNLKNTNEKLDNYEKQIAYGHDKYQIGRAIGRLNTHNKKSILEFVSYTIDGNDEEINNLKRKLNQKIQNYNLQIQNIDLRIKSICNSDVSLENGFEDFIMEYNAQLNQKKFEDKRRETDQKRQEELAQIKQLAEERENTARLRVVNLENQIVELKKQNADTNKQLGNYMKCAACKKRDNCWMKMHKSMRDVCSGPF